MSNKRTLELSRRKALASLGAIGVASAGAGLGTSAYFTDEESFEDNVLTAGELDLAVSYDSAYNSDGAADNQATEVSGFVNGSNTIFFTFEDVKPGDEALVEFCFQSVDNPAYVWMCGQLDENAQNGINDPEQQALDDEEYVNESLNQTIFQSDVVDGGNKVYDEGDWGGQLAQSIQMTVGYSKVDGSSGASVTEPDGDVTADMELEIESGTMAELMTSGLSVPLDAIGDTTDLGNYTAADPGNQTAFDASEELADEDGDGDFASPCVQMAFEVPATTTNIIQSDSVTFGVLFHAEQDRHNSGGTSPCGFENGDGNGDGGGGGGGGDD